MFLRYALSGAAGILLALAFPNAGIAGFAWIAPGILLASALGCTGAQAFRLGYAGGVAHYLASLNWLLFIPFPAGAVAGWLALSGYLALYPAAWVWICWRLFPRRIFDSNRTDEAGSLLTASGKLIEQFAATSILQRAIWALACAIFWVALEMLRARLLTGFPWNLLGVSQSRILPVIQIASLTGVYGVSFLMAWFSVALVCACAALIARPASGRFWLGDILLPLVAVGLAGGFGVKKITGAKAATNTMKIALIQPSIPQTLIWDPKENTNRFQHLLRLTEAALKEKPSLLVWPEAAVPNILRFEPEAFESVRKLAIDHRVWMILGADDAVAKVGSATGREFDFYNSSFLIDPTGETAAMYRKRRLVIFGEYVPLVRWLPFLKYLTPIGEGFKCGDAPVPFALPDLNVKTSVLICFEDAFPHLASEHAGPESDFLLNLTNDGWFGESAAQWQHAANAVFRAVENGLPLVRCGNNGLSCWVDSLGGLHEVFFRETQDIYGAGFKLAEVPIQGRQGKREPTFYNRHGDWFGWGCVGLAAGLVAASAFNARTAQRASGKRL